MTRIWGKGYMPLVDQTPEGFVVSMPIESGFATFDVSFPVSTAAVQIIQTDPARIWLLYAAVHVLAHAAQYKDTWPAFTAGLPQLSETILELPLSDAMAQMRAIDRANPRAGLRYMVKVLSEGAVTVDDAWHLGGSALGAG
jgi:hypothetical protein